MKQIDSDENKIFNQKQVIHNFSLEKLLNSTLYINLILCF